MSTHTYPQMRPETRRLLGVLACDDDIPDAIRCSAGGLIARHGNICLMGTTDGQLERAAQAVLAMTDAQAGEHLGRELARPKRRCLRLDASAFERRCVLGSGHAGPCDYFGDAAPAHQGQPVEGSL